MPYPTKPKGGWQRPRQVVVNKSTAQLKEKKATQNEKRLPGGTGESLLTKKTARLPRRRRLEVPQTTIMAKDPVAHMMTPQEYLHKVAAGQMLQMANHQMMQELADKKDETKILMMEFRDIERPKPK